MKKLVISLLILSCLLGCSNEYETNQSADIIYYDDESLAEIVDIEVVDNQLRFKGGIIEIQQEELNNKTLTIQQITQKRRDINFSAKKIPMDLYFKNKNLSDEDFRVALSQVEEEQLFYFEFEEELKQDLIKKHLQENLDENISYLSFNIAQDFQLITMSGDTLESSYSLYERSFHTAPYERLLVSFTGVDQAQEMELLYNDKIFGNGNFKFSFASSEYLDNKTKNPS